MLYVDRPAIANLKKSNIFFLAYIWRKGSAEDFADTIVTRR